jgi:hypothetical protein
MSEITSKNLTTQELKNALEEAVVKSVASDYDKGNILYLAEELVDSAVSDLWGKTYSFLHYEYRDICREWEHAIEEKPPEVK